MLRRLLCAVAVASVAVANNDKLLTSRLGPVVDLGYAVSPPHPCHCLFSYQSTSSRATGLHRQQLPQRHRLLRRRTLHSTPGQGPTLAKTSTVGRIMEAVSKEGIGRCEELWPDLYPTTGSCRRRSGGSVCARKPIMRSDSRQGFWMTDCVTLNIWKPSGANQDSKLPVVVYIHVSIQSNYQTASIKRN